VYWISRCLMNIEFCRICLNYARFRVGMKCDCGLESSVYYVKKFGSKNSLSPRSSGYFSSHTQMLGQLVTVSAPFRVPCVTVLPICALTLLCPQSIVHSSHSMSFAQSVRQSLPFWFRLAVLLFVRLYVIQLRNERQWPSFKFNRS
jgi:hypothetical protein